MSRPRVLVVADTPGWAWHTKARAYATHLADAFDVTVAYQVRGVPPLDGFDLVHCFEVSQLDGLPATRVPLVAGLTAHVWRTWGEARMRGWAARVAALHGNSRLLVAELAPFHPRVCYTPNGVDADFWHRMRPRKDGTVVACHVGKPNPRKGAALIAEACHRAGLRCLLVQRTAHIRLAPEQIRELYQDAWVQVTASDMDGTPNPALESAACGNALLSNPIGNMPEVIVPGVNGFLVERTVEALAERLAWCRDHPDETAALGEAARATILAGWTWRHQVRHVAALWTEVLA